MMSGCIVYNEGAKNNSFHRPFYKKVKDQIGRARSDTENADFEIFDAYHELDEKFDKDYDWCPYCQILPVIGADQNIYPCQDKAYNLMEGLLGSIRTQSFKDFWFSDKNVFFKVNPQDHCRHHCVANGKNKLILDYYSVDLKHLAFV